MRRLWARWQFGFRRVGRWLVWGLLVLTLFRLGVVSGKTRVYQDLATAEVAPAATAVPMDEGAGAFAAAFVWEYFTYSADTESARRAQQLAAFLAPGLDPQAGLLSGSLQGHQRVTAAWPWRTEHAAPDRLRVTVVAAVTSSPGPEGAESRRYLAVTVPVAVVGPGRYIVYDLPAFAPWSPQSVQPPGPTYPAEEVLDPDRAIQGVLRAFFRAYAGGTPNEIAVFTLGDPLQGLDGRIQFRQLLAYRLLRNGAGLLALVDVEMQDPATQAIYRQRYTLGLVQEANRWLVQTVNPRFERSVPGEGQS